MNITENTKIVLVIVGLLGIGFVTNNINIGSSQSELAFTLDISYVDGTSASVSDPVPLSILYDDKSVSSISLVAYLYIELTGDASSGSFDGQLRTLYDSQQRQINEMGLPPISIVSGEIYELASTTVSKDEMDQWSQNQVGSHILAFETPESSLLTINFEDGTVATKEFTQASASIMLTYNADSSIDVAEIDLEPGTEEEPDSTPPSANMYRYSVNYNGLNWKDGGAWRDLDTQFSYIKSWGFDCVNWVTDFGLDPEVFEATADFYAAAQRNGLKLLIAYYWWGGTRDVPYGGFDHWINTWRNLAQSCPNAIFDLWHENGMPPNTWKTRMQQCVDAIRQYSNSPIIIYPPGPWCTLDALRDGWKIDGENIYYGLTFVDYSEDYDSYGGHQTYNQFYSDLEERNIIWALDNGYNFVVADMSCGPDSFNAGAPKAPYVRVFLQVLDDLNVGWNVWSWGTKYLNLVNDAYGTPSTVGQAFKDAMQG